MYENLSPEEVEWLAERAAYLVSGFIEGTLSQEEHDELDRWVAASEFNVRLFKYLTEEGDLEAKLMKLFFSLPEVSN